MTAAFDELVATRVMCWHKASDVLPRWMNAADQYTFEDYQDQDDYYQPTYRWQPSQDIADAWIVMERLRERRGPQDAAFPPEADGYIELVFDPHHDIDPESNFVGDLVPMWVCRFTSDEFFYRTNPHGAAETAAMAICLAALRVFDVPEALIQLALKTKD
jgi:hypothetical protein